MGPTSTSQVERELGALRLTYDAALRSPDPSTQNAAVLCLPYGHPIRATLAVNEFPDGVAYSDERWERPTKYAFVEHAERHAIYQAAQVGVPTRGLTMVCPWAACADCARAIICAGISRLVTVRADTNDRWDASIDVAMGMLEEARVAVEAWDVSFGDMLPIRRNGALLYP